jgi:hypothetical protein
VQKTGHIYFALTGPARSAPVQKGDSSLSSGPQNGGRSLLDEDRADQARLVDIGDVKAHVADLRGLLSEGAIMEQRSFLRSFIKRIVVDPPNITIEYTVPLKPNEAEPLEREVLPVASSGSPGRTRTTNLLVNSQSLYH